MRRTTFGQVAFALVLVALGSEAVVHRTFPAAWTPALEHVPAKTPLAFTAALVLLICGVGLLLQRFALPAARVLFSWSLLWFLSMRLPILVSHPRDVGAWYEVSEMAVMVAGAWALYIRLRTDWDPQHSGLAAGRRSLTAARTFYALPLFLFGYGHFVYLKSTAALVPSYLPSHTAWAIFTACTFFAVGLSILIGVCARLATALSALQIGLFVLLVYLPLILKNTATPFQINEAVVSTALCAAACVVAESYRGSGWTSRSTP